MSQRENFPDLLANHLTDAVRLAAEFNVSIQVVVTAPPRGASQRTLRVVRQRLAEDGQTLELVVSAENWGKEV